MLSEVFWVAFITTVSGVVIKLASMMYKSKCKECSCFGISIKRDVLTEEKEAEFMALNKTKSTSDQKEDV
jgi:hypothetical protein